MAEYKIKNSASEKILSLNGLAQALKNRKLKQS
jgi:hypothetical protein